MKKRIAIIAILMMVISIYGITFVSYGDSNDGAEDSTIYGAELNGKYTIEEYEQRKVYAHEIAENARKLGMSENNYIILTAKEIWHDADDNINYLKSLRWWTDYELNMLASLIYYEAGSNDCTDRHQQLVGQVVINRMNSSEFANSIYGVITQKGQYSTYKNVLSMASTPSKIPKRCYDNALAVLEGRVECPDNIVWQANFRQGSSIYEIHKTSYSTTYFCYR